MILIRLALASLISRKGSALLTLFAISVSIFVLLGVELVRQQAKDSFGRTVSGIDLIVGARTGDVNLLLQSVFRIGHTSHNVRWSSYQDIANLPQVAWTIPIMLGDSHKGFAVMGTNEAFFNHFQFGNQHPLTLSEGVPFRDTFDVVLGSEVARTLDYSLESSLVLAHGLASTSFSQHSDSPFRVVGILAPTGTPVDQALYVSLAAIEAIHSGWQGQPTNSPSQPMHQPKSITAFMVGLESKLATFGIQRKINNYTKEPLLAILPGVTLSQLWEMMTSMENTLRLISVLVLLAAELGLAAMLLASIRERRGEITVLRAIGAPAWLIIVLIEIEALLVTLAACVAALVALYVAVSWANAVLSDGFGLVLAPQLFTKSNLILLASILISVAAIALVPGVSAYRQKER